MNQPVKENQILNVRIESIGAKGDGIAKVNGLAVIVPNTKADKEYTVKITKLKERFAFAEIVEA